MMGWKRLMVFATWVTLNASRGCEVAVTARARLGWVKFREYGELLHHHHRLSSEP